MKKVIRIEIEIYRSITGYNISEIFLEKLDNEGDKKEIISALSKSFTDIALNDFRKNLCNTLNNLLKKNVTFNDF